MTIDHEDLIAEARKRASAKWKGMEGSTNHLVNRLADALEASDARLREAEAVIEKVREIVEPPKPLELGKSMMRSFDRMIGDLRRATYKPTSGGDAGVIGTGNSPSPTGQQAPASGDGMEEPSTPPRSTPRHHPNKLTTENGSDHA